MIYKGTLQDFQGSWGSGIGQLIVERRIKGKKSVKVILCENAPTGRALGAAFNAIGPGHTIDNEKIHGKEIVYSVGDFGLLEWFSPVDEWNGPEIPPEGLDPDAGAVA